jgi:hypothetical protein
VLSEAQERLRELKDKLKDIDKEIFKLLGVYDDGN